MDRTVWKIFACAFVALALLMTGVSQAASSTYTSTASSSEGIDLAIISRIASAWASQGKEVETAMAITSAGSGGEVKVVTGGIIGGTQVGSEATSITYPSMDEPAKPVTITYPSVDTCTRLYEGSKTEKEGYTIKVIGVAKRTGSEAVASSKPVVPSNTYDPNAVIYATIGIYDGKGNLLKSTTVEEGTTFTWTSSGGDVITVTVCDAYYGTEIASKTTDASTPVVIKPLSWASLKVNVETAGTGCICTAEYAPVCGVNGKTYSNKCVAGCAGVSVAHTGQCDETKPVLGTKIILHRQHRNCADDSLYQPTMQGKNEQVFEVGGNTGYWNFKCADRKQEQCYGDGSFDTYYYEWCSFEPTTSQSESTDVVLHRQHLNCTNNQPYGGTTTDRLEQVFEVGGDTGYWNFKCADRKQEQCYGDGTFDTYYKEWCEFRSSTGQTVTPQPICPPGCTPSGTGCDCPSTNNTQPTPVTPEKQTILHRQHRNCADDSLYQPTMQGKNEQVFEVGGNTGYWNFKCADRKQEQCYGDGSFDTYYYEWCEYKNADTIVKVPEVIPTVPVATDEKLTATDSQKPSTRVSILNYELGNVPDAIKQKLLKALEAGDQKTVDELRKILDSHVDYVLAEKQGIAVSPINSKASAIQTVAVKDEPASAVAVNVVKQKTLDAETIRKLLEEKKSATEIVSQIQATGTEKVSGGVVVNGKGYAVSAASGSGVNGMLVTKENGQTKEVGDISIQANDGVVDGAVKIYNKLLSIVSK